MPFNNIISIGEIEICQRMITTTAHKTKHQTVRSRKTARTQTAIIVTTATATTRTTTTTIRTTITTISVWQDKKRGDKGVSSFFAIGNACVYNYFLLRYSYEKI